MDREDRKVRWNKMNLQLSAAIHGTSNGHRQNITAKTVTTLGVLVPVLPARLKEVRRGQEGIITEDSSNSKSIWRAIREDKLLNLISQVSELGLDSRAKLVGSQQTGLAIKSDDRETVDEGQQGAECLWKLCRGSLIGQEACLGGDGEGVQGMGDA
jgi:hypothetical protein